MSGGGAILGHVMTLASEAWCCECAATSADVLARYDLTEASGEGLASPVTEDEAREVGYTCVNCGRALLDVGPCTD